MGKNNYDFRIIIVDDNVDIHKDFLKILTKMNYTEPPKFQHNSDAALFEDSILPLFQIDTTTQGEEGISLIKKAMSDKEPYALAFVDIRNPPEWEGIETVKNIWAIDPDIHVVICTASSDYSWEKMIRDLAHTKNFLPLKKPFDRIAVRQLAYALTRKWKLMRESRIYTTSLEKAVEKRTEELKYQATHDELTGLSNRVLLYDRMHQAIAMSKRHQQGFAVLFFDLDRFKLINDSLGHAAGDQLLSIISKRLLASIRTIDTLARLGGDEFIMVVNELKDIDLARVVATKVLKITNEPMEVDGHSLHITSSMGIAFFPQDGTEVANLLRNADSAMYHSKKLGGDQFQFYSTALNEKALEQQELESELYQAVSNDQLVIWYQPQFNIENDQFEAVEALVRWKHPKKGMLLPMDFIPLAEQTGLIIPMGEWIIKEACRQNKAWQDSGLAPIRMAVNVTSHQLSQPDFIQKIRDILSDIKLEPKYLELELNENAITNDIMVTRINELKALGIEIALDDFGTGYSSLHHLRNITLDRLKIDRSFIDNIQLNRNDEVIINAIIAMARSLNLEVLAEGVETQKQLEFLKNHDCTKMQGFYFSKPLPAHELRPLLEDPKKIKWV